jgi:cell division protein FtsQ
MKFFNWSTIRLFLMFGLVIFMFSFTSMKNSARKLLKTEVVFVEDENVFVTSETVNKLLIENNQHPKTIAKEGVDLDKLEKSINSHNMIEKSEVFVTINGVLKAVVKQRTPIVRVSLENETFYFDYQGNKMPLSENLSARVPLVSGSINESNNKNLIAVFRYIFNDNFLKKNIIGVEVFENGSLIMRNREYDFEIDFGRPIHIKDKFNNYKAFFQKAEEDSLLTKYKKINLKFTHQVVCTK